ncbi:MAG: hypothetical protein JO211_14605, partial [Acidobacteriaceae bacterium]|nr:hypothetical protein [Acidobacteriaceae bacterium]
MFQLFFKYPGSVFAKGSFVLLGSWPHWILWTGIVCAAGLFAVLLWRAGTPLRPSMRGLRAMCLWGLQSALVAILLLLLWQPAISITSLKPQQNIVAVVIDDSESMALKDAGASRQEQAVKLLDSGLLKELANRFQVRLYRLGAGVERIHDPHELCAMQPATQIGKGLGQLADEAATLPIGAVVLMSDGADNTGGVDRETMSELRRRRLPVNTVGFGREQLTNDVELD